MRRIITFFVDQGIFGEILTVAVIAIGLYSMFNIRREVFPNVNFDVLTVNTRFQGASAQEIEKLVTNPIEQEFNEVDGIKKMRSISIEGMSGIFVWLDPDQTTGAKAKDDLKDAVDKVELPEGIDRTKTTLIESKDGPVIEVCIGGDLSDIELRNIAKKLETELEDIPGVSKVVHVGLRDPEIRVEVSRNKLAQYRLSFEDINQALRGQNLSIPGGPIENASAATTEPERIVRTVGEFSTTEEIGRTVLRANDLGAGIRLKDIANIYSDLEKAEILNRTNGKPSLSLTVLKKEKFDAIDMVDAVKLKL